jgi:LEA14-like dessication related protein
MKDKIILFGLGYLVLSHTTLSFSPGISCRFKRLEFDGIGGDFKSVRLIMGIDVKNDNVADIPYDGFNGELTYLGRHLTSIRDVKPVLVRGRSTTEVQFAFSVSLDNLKTVFGANWSQFIANFKNFTERSNFHIRGELAFLIVNRKFTYNLDQAL